LQRRERRCRQQQKRRLRAPFFSPVAFASAARLHQQERLLRRNIAAFAWFAFLYPE
jgi:hypothetical protein